MLILADPLAAAAAIHSSQQQQPMAGFKAEQPSHRKADASQQRLIQQAEQLQQQGNLEQAIALLANAQRLGPDALDLLANLYLSCQAWDQAIDICGRIERGFTADQRSQRIKQLLREGADAANSGHAQHAIALHCRLLALDPEHSLGLRNLAILLRRSGDLKAAQQFIQRYLNTKPNCPQGLNTYGTILTDLGQHDDAINAYQRAVQADPNNADAFSNLACEHHLKAQIDSAFVCSTRAIALAPQRELIWLDHLTHLRRACAFDRLEKLNWWRLLDRLTPELVSSAFLQVLVLAEQQADQARLLSCISRWGDSQAQAVQALPAPPALPSDPQEPLRIGFVSADFRDHSVARFIWPLFEHLDRSRFALFGYSTYRVQDSWRARFDQHATAMRDVAALSPQQLCRTIRADNIHILFDLTGFTKGSRTAAFAWRAAPVQISWLGFPGTSGLPQMDYLFLDRHLAPDDPSLIREQPLISPGTTVCFSQIDPVPITPVIPELVHGHLTLGTLNNSYKLTRATIARWSRVLQALPTAQFLFVRREFQSYYLRSNLIAEFERNGISGERIHFFNNRLAGRHYLDCYNELDFTLDTFPVTGGTTTTDALWMGVPVVGLEGPNVHQRVCSAILHHAGHPEWIARTDDEFVQIALDLAADQQRRTDLRQSLRSELQASLLCNTQQFAADFAAAMESLRPKKIAN